MPAWCSQYRDHRSRSRGPPRRGWSRRRTPQRAVALQSAHSEPRNHPPIVDACHQCVSILGPANQHCASGIRAVSESSRSALLPVISRAVRTRTAGPSGCRDWRGAGCDLGSPTQRIDERRRRAPAGIGDNQTCSSCSELLSTWLRLLARPVLSQIWAMVPCGSLSKSANRRAARRPAGTSSAPGRSTEARSQRRTGSWRPSCWTPIPILILRFNPHQFRRRLSDLYLDGDSLP